MFCFISVSLVGHWLVRISIQFRRYLLRSFIWISWAQNEPDVDAPLNRHKHS